ncbi:transposase [Enterococcus faecalis]|uniref:transposase n=1 Tax=Enterococcus faecalis TaxID=1351 RepID=UPI0021E08467|nr:transposase [Enterococcus faecalis]MCU9758216.1 transposase [Enterococcus faecalis]MCU9772517.1 transposase [Enterococcus faecalis]MCU9772814.1 transposase [Enterococcus faecalis]MCU9792150.1 transposase [Enterococcus faecalis]
MIGLNNSHGTVVKEVFPNAQISIDRFHVIQQLTRPLIQAINQLKKSGSQTLKNYLNLKNIGGLY